MDTTENNAFRATEDDWRALRKEIVERSQASQDGPHLNPPGNRKTVKSNPTKKKE